MEKLQAEVQKLLDRKYQRANSELQATYQRSLQPLLAKLSIWVEKYSKLTFSQQREFEKNLNMAKIVADIADGIYKDANGNLTALLDDAGQTAYSGQMYAFEQSEEIDLNFLFIDNDEVRAISQREVNGRTFSQRLYKNTNQLARNVQQAILDGLWQGNGDKEIASRLTELSEADYKRSERIARTEMGRVQGEATEKAYDSAADQGVSFQKQWLATLSNRTRDDHAKLDGQQADDEGYFHIHEYKAKHPHGFGVPSEDINCRCTTIAVVNGYEPELRRDETARQQVNYKNYQDWFAKRPNRQSGALNDKNDPDYKRRYLHAEKFYGLLRKSDQENLAAKMAKSSGMDKNDVSKVLNHVLFEKHELQSKYDPLTTEKRVFDPDYYMANSFARLRDGTPNEADMLLLKHELHESNLMKSGLGYEEAHDMTEVIYNYREAILKEE